MALIEATESETLTQDQVLDLLWPLLWAGVLWAVGQAITSVLVSIAAARIVAIDLAGDTPNWADASRFTLRKLMPAIGAALLLVVGTTFLISLAAAVGWALISRFGAEFLPVFLTTVAGLTALFVTVWIGLSASLYPQALALDDTGPVASLVRSFGLVSGHWWPTFAFLLVTGLIASVAAQILSIPLVPLYFAVAIWPGLLGAVYGLSIALQAPIAAGIAVAATLWYLDLRARRGPLSAEELIRP
jgi:hypothetical protein